MNILHLDDTFFKVSEICIHYWGIFMNGLIFWIYPALVHAVSVCVCVGVYPFIHAHTHTHIIYIIRTQDFFLRYTVGHYGYKHIKRF